MTNNKRQTRPSATLRSIIAGYPTVSAAARAFGLGNMTLYRFLRGTGGLNANSVASIMETTKQPYNALFTHKEDK